MCMYVVLIRKTLKPVIFAAVVVEVVLEVVVIGYATACVVVPTFGPDRNVEQTK